MTKEFKKYLETEFKKRMTDVLDGIFEDACEQHWYAAQDAIMHDLEILFGNPRKGILVLVDGRFKFNRPLKKNTLSEVVDNTAWGWEEEYFDDATGKKRFASLLGLAKGLEKEAARIREKVSALQQQIAESSTPPKDS